MLPYKIDNCFAAIFVVIYSAHSIIKFFPFSPKIALLKYKNMAVLVVFDGFWDKKVEFSFWRTNFFTENYND